MPSVLRVSWAYSLGKKDLSSYLTKFGCETGGTVDEQRKRFTQFLAGQLESECFKRLLQLQTKHEVTPPEAKPVTAKRPPLITINPTMEHATNGSLNAPDSQVTAKATHPREVSITV